jgi:hypothetical protein
VNESFVIASKKEARLIYKIMLSQVKKVESFTINIDFDEEEE